MAYIMMLIMSFFSSAQTPSTPAEKPLIQSYPERPLLNEVIAFEPIAGHKFNLKSNNYCGNGSRVSEAEDKIECQMSAPGTSELQLYVCDEQKTFCKREVFKIITQQPKGFGGWVKYYKDNLVSRRDWFTPYKSGVSQNSVAKGFSHNDLSAKIAQAKKDKKKLLVYFSQTACDPCRLLKEMTLASDEFQIVLKDYIAVQLDFDLDIDPEKTKPLNVKGTPTLIVFDKDFNELARTSGLLSPQSLKNWLELKTPSEPIWVQLAAVAKTDQDKITVAKTVQPETLVYTNSSWLEYVQLLSVVALAPAVDSGLFSQAVSLLGALEPKIKSAPIDDLQKAYVLNTYYGKLQHVYLKSNRLKEVKAIKARQLAALNVFPKLPGVSETAQLDLYKAEAADNPEIKKKAYDLERAKNKTDYSYDYWEAGEAYARKDYSLALQLVEKSLLVAKDRGWQKAFTLKLDILQALKKEPEALKAIDDLLMQLKLPSQASMKVHPFVQSLRKKQAELKTPQA